MLPVERVYVTARRRDGTPARWTAKTTADWVQLQQCTDPDRVEVTMTPQPGITRANIEIRNEETGDVTTVRMALRVRAARRTESTGTSQPPADARPVTERTGPTEAAKEQPGPPISTLPETMDAPGDTDAMVRRGSLALDRGEADEAEHWFLQAAKAGNTDAMVNLGALALDRGEADETEQWFLQAAKAGNTDAMVNLGALAQSREDAKGAKQWFRKAVDAGNTAGMIGLGTLAQSREDVKGAKQWFRKATDAGNTAGMVCLGLLALDRDEADEAEQWFLRAAEADDTDGMVSLGSLAESRGDADSAEHWFRKAAEAGSTDAMNRLTALLRQGPQSAALRQCDLGPADPHDTTVNDSGSCSTSSELLAGALICPVVPTRTPRARTEINARLCCPQQSIEGNMASTDVSGNTWDVPGDQESAPRHQCQRIASIPVRAGPGQCPSGFTTSSLTLTNCPAWPGSGRKRSAGRSSLSARSSSDRRECARRHVLHAGHRSHEVKNRVHLTSLPALRTAIRRLTACLRSGAPGPHRADWRRVLTVLADPERTSLHRARKRRSPVKAEMRPQLSPVRGTWVRLGRRWHCPENDGFSCRVLGPGTTPPASRPGGLGLRNGEEVAGR